MTLAVIYPQNAFRIRVVSNLPTPIKAVLDDFPLEYGIKTAICIGKTRFGELIEQKVRNFAAQTGELKYNNRNFCS